MSLGKDIEKQKAKIIALQEQAATMEIEITDLKSQFDKANSDLSESVKAHTDAITTLKAEHKKAIDGEVAKAVDLKAKADETAGKLATAEGELTEAKALLQNPAHKHAQGEEPVPAGSEPKVTTAEKTPLYKKYLAISDSAERSKFWTDNIEALQEECRKLQSDEDAKS